MSRPCSLLSEEMPSKSLAFYIPSLLALNPGVSIFYIPSSIIPTALLAAHQLKAPVNRPPTGQARLTQERQGFRVGLLLGWGSGLVGESLKNRTAAVQQPSRWSYDVSCISWDPKGGISFTCKTKNICHDFSPPSGF